MIFISFHLMEAAQILIKRIQELSKSRSFSDYIHIKNILGNQKIPIAFFTHDTSIILRCRPHNKNSTQFKHKDELSYRKDILNINSFGRCNEPGQPIFYCSDQDNENTGIVESLSLFRGKKRSKSETITIGAWKVKEPLKLALILPPKTNLGKNQFFDEMMKFYRTYSNSDYYNELLTFNDYLCEEFSKDIIKEKTNYFISCAYSNYIREHFSDQIDGIAYGSVKSQHEGVNIALWPESVDKKLDLIAAIKRTSKRFPGKIFGEIKVQESISVDKITGNIIWGPEKNTGFEEVYKMKLKDMGFLIRLKYWLSRWLQL